MISLMSDVCLRNQPEYCVEKGCEITERRISLKRECWEILPSSFGGAAVGGFLGTGVGSAVSYYLGNTVIYTCVGLSAGAAVGAVVLGELIHRAYDYKQKND